jgi:hypothetical protein
MKTRSLLIQNKNDFRYAVKRKNDWDSFIAAHHELERHADEVGLPICDTSSLVPSRDFDFYTSNVAWTLRAVDELISENCHPNFKSTVMGQLARQLYWFELYKNRDRNFNQVIYFRNHSRKLLKLNEPVCAKAIYSHVHLASNVPDRHYVIDFQSPSGRKTGIFPNLKNIHSIKFTSLMSYIYHASKPENNTIYITVTPVKKQANCVCWEKLKNKFEATLSHYLFNKINSEYYNFTAHYNTLEKMFKKKRLPAAVYFNFVKDTRMAACLAFFGDQGVKINMQSHGALHVFGNSDEITISKTLSQSIYNCPPGISEVYLRSKLQLYGLPDNVSANLKLVSPKTNFLKKNKFQILIAPNFTNWLETPWGLHSTCHDTIRVLSHLALLMHATPEIDWTLRLKFSLSDVPKESDLNRMQGLSTHCVQSMFQGLKNFKDVSKQSYNSCIQNSDLIITEGLTTVPYDSWENCRPVLFLRSSKNVRGLQRRTDESMRQYFKRGAYHSQSLENFTTDQLYRLRDLYWNKPLENDELKNVLRVQ